MWNKKWIVYTNQRQLAQWLDQEDAPKHFPRPNWHQKNIMVTVQWSAGLIHYSFLNPRETITSEKYAQQIHGMHWEFQWLQLELVNREHPVLLRDNTWLKVAQPMLLKLKDLGYKILPHLPCSPDLLPTDYHFAKHLYNFSPANCFCNQQEAENAFQEFAESQRWIFILQK